jgi:hypothetical protein
MRTIVLALALMAPADDATGPKADPMGTPLELSITGEKTYTLDTDGKTPAEYRKGIENALAADRVPESPKTDLKVLVKNTGDKPLRLWTNGDPVVLTLELKGDGAINFKPRLAFTREFRIPEAVEVAPGKTVEIPVKTLSSGFRGLSKRSYWTTPGEYKLVVTLKTGVNPAPEGAKVRDGFGQVTLTSAPFAVKVEKK